MSKNKEYILAIENQWRQENGCPLIISDEMLNSHHDKINTSKLAMICLLNSNVIGFFSAYRGYNKVEDLMYDCDRIMEEKPVSLVAMKIYDVENCVEITDIKEYFRYRDKLYNMFDVEPTDAQEADTYRIMIRKLIQQHQKLVIKDIKNKIKLNYAFIDVQKEIAKLNLCQMEQDSK